MITAAMDVQLWIFLSAHARPPQAKAAACFPFEAISPRLRAYAEKHLLNALNSEALPAGLRPNASKNQSGFPKAYIKGYCRRLAEPGIAKVL